MKLHPLHLSLVLAVLLTAGCEKPSSQPAGSAGGVAIIDLDEVAKRLGRDVVIADELKSTRNSLAQQLVDAQKSLEGEFDKSRGTLGANPSAADTQKLSELGQNLNAQFQQKQQEAEQEFRAKTLALLNRFREEIKPVALKVAAAKGFSVVIVKSEATVLANENNADITDAVVTEMIGGSKAATATPAASPNASPSASP